eukprot:g977.t1
MSSGQPKSADDPHRDASAMSSGQPEPADAPHRGAAAPSSGQPEPADAPHRDASAMSSGQPEPADDSHRDAAAPSSGQPEPADDSHRGAAAPGSGQPEPADDSHRDAAASSPGQPEPARRWNYGAGSGGGGTCPGGGELVDLLQRRQGARRARDSRRADSIREYLWRRGVNVDDHRGVWWAGDGRRGLMRSCPPNIPPASNAMLSSLNARGVTCGRSPLVS